jgi:hypothetical protein
MTNKEFLLKVAELVYDINETTNHTAFLGYQAHVQLIDVSIHLGGWKTGVGHDCQFRHYMDEADIGSTQQEVLTGLEQLLEV